MTYSSASSDNPPDALICVINVFVVPASSTETETSVTKPVKIVVSTPVKLSSVTCIVSKISTSVYGRFKKSIVANPADDCCCTVLLYALQNPLNRSGSG